MTRARPDIVPIRSKVPAMPWRARCPVCNRTMEEQAPQAGRSPALAEFKCRLDGATKLVAKDPARRERVNTMLGAGKRVLRWV